MKIGRLEENGVEESSLKQCPLPKIVSASHTAERWCMRVQQRGGHELAFTYIKLVGPFTPPRECSHMKLKPEKPLRHTVSFCLHTYRNLSHAPEQCFESKYCFKSIPYVHVHHYIKISRYITLKNLSDRIYNLSSGTIISVQLLAHTV